LLLREQSHSDDRDEEQADHAGVVQQWTNDLLVDVHRHHLPAHLLLHADIVEVCHPVPEEEAEDHGKHREQQPCNRRHEIAAQFFLKNDPDVSHAVFPWATVLAVSVSCAVSCRKISSRLIAVGRSSFRSQPDSTTARARSPRTNPFWLSTSKLTRLSRVSLSDTRLTPETRSKRERTVAESRLPFRPAISTSIDSAPRARACRFSTESVATSLPLLMMITFSHVCSTSGRMWVLRIIV